MVNTNSFLENRWSKPSSTAYGHYNMWHQSKHGRPLRKRLQNEFIQRQLKSERKARFRNCIRQITRDCKEMLKKKMEEIDLYNSTINQPQSHNILQNKYRRHRCFKCRQRGHVIKNCPMRKHDEGTQRTGNISETAKVVNEGFMTTKPTVSLKYPEWIHFTTKCMIKGTDQGHWDDICRHFGLKDDLIEIKGALYSTRVNTFNEYVAFLNLIKQDEIISQKWDIFRERFDKVVKWFYKSYLEKPLHGLFPLKINGVEIHLFDLYKLVEGLGGYLSVYFENEFSTIGEILGLSKHDGEEIKRCYINYLDVFTSYYKTARVPKQGYNPILDIPTKNVEEGKEYTCLTSHQCGFAEIKAPNMEAANKKEKDEIEHFGIKLEDTRNEPDSFQPIQPSIK
uniref:ARID DNA-binding domain-containing protein n=1 Tax=Tanacetum cinerariifolium TaxID=118510 RepID=A0A6L2KXT0_TANCI|nr:ARID DNA-binding domain-containing protein [Tanacetum cinerariifolium]